MIYLGIYPNLPLAKIIHLLVFTCFNEKSIVLLLCIVHYFELKLPNSDALMPSTDELCAHSFVRSDLYNLFDTKRFFEKKINLIFVTTIFDLF